MRELYPHKYQEDCAIAAAIKQRLAIIAQPGMGKTVIALRYFQLIQPKRALIVAPLSVALNTWPEEIMDWDLFCDIPFAVLHPEGIKFPNPKIDIVNPAQLHKISGRYDMLVVDESTLYKSVSSKRFKRLRDISKTIPNRITLTGNPIPNDYQDLFAQMALVDGGESLGRFITHYREKYFERVPQHIGGGQMVDNWKLRPEADKLIQKAVSRRTYAINADKLLDMPELIETDLWVSMSREAQETYDALERELFAEIGEIEIMSVSAGGAYAKAHQLANGRCYGENKSVAILHSEKIERLKVLVNELGGQPLLVSYLYRHDFDAIKAAFPDVLDISKANVGKWNTGEVRIGAAQLQSASRGLNLQRGGRHLAFYSLTDNYDDYYQMVCRLYRQGQKNKVFVYRLVTRKTVDEAILTRIRRKTKAPAEFIAALKAYRFAKIQGFSLVAKN